MPTVTEERKIALLARQYRHENPHLGPGKMFRLLRAGESASSPGAKGALHLDDSSTIAGIEYFPESAYFQDRARWRAGDGDVLVTSTPVNPEFEAYFQKRLGLGRPRWLRVQGAQTLRLAEACWVSRETRERLVSLLEKGRFRAFHPYMGSFHAWALAALLARAAHRPLDVIAPSPQLARRVNDKNWFSLLVRRLLGTRATPRSFKVFSDRTLVSVVRHGLGGCKALVVKVPNSAGGKDNLVFDGAELGQGSERQLREYLRRRLEPLHWDGSSPLQVSCWEDKVLGSPSVQLWIPPLESGLPVQVDGLFEQVLLAGRGEFLGSMPARLAPGLRRRLVRPSVLLARLLQQLGYVGRCSFDLLLTGDAMASSRIEFIECNGRWGGTSGPMHLVDRLFGRDGRPVYATHHYVAPELAGMRFAEIARAFEPELYDAASGTGWLILLTASGLPIGHLDFLALGKSSDEAKERAYRIVPRRLHSLADDREAA